MFWLRLMQCLIICAWIVALFVVIETVCELCVCKASHEIVVQEDIVNAMALTGQFLMGQAVMVKSSEVRLCRFTFFLIMMVSLQSAQASLCLCLLRVGRLPPTNPKTHIAQPPQEHSQDIFLK